jgi:hypothetical protein
MRNKGQFVYVNGHRPIPAVLAGQIIDLLKRTSRPMTSREVAGELRYSVDHVGSNMRSMVTDGVLKVAKMPGLSNVYGMPGWLDFALATDPAVPSKHCPRCERILPLTDFGFDQHSGTGRTSRCHWCRSPRADKSRVRRYPARGNVPRRG